MVFVSVSVLRNPSSLAGGMPLGQLPFASQSKTTFARAVFLQTRMKTGGRGSPFFCHSANSASHKPASIAIGVCAHLSTASGLGLACLPPRSAGVRRPGCRIQRQMLK